MQTVWEKIEARWPARIGVTPFPYLGLEPKMRTFLHQHKIDAAVLSHFGVVVKNMDSSLAAMTDLSGRTWQPKGRDWVERSGVHVARGDLDGIEIEVIEPVKEGLGLNFLKTHGEGLHHVSFEVDNIHDCVKRLAANGVSMADRKARRGLHGWIAFVQPRMFSPLYLELCQSRADSR